MQKKQPTAAENAAQENEKKIVKKQVTKEISKSYLADFWSDQQINNFKKLVESIEEENGATVKKWIIKKRRFKNPRNGQVVKTIATATFYLKRK